MTRLIPFEEPDSQGRQRYKPFIDTVGKTSKFRPGMEFELMGVGDYWNWPDRAPKPTEGQKFQLWVTTKPKGGNAKPGSVYRDVVRAEPIAADQEGQEWVDVSNPPAPARNDESWGNPRDKESVKAPVEKVSPFAGRPVPAEWTMTHEYWMWRHETERLSIETQTALKSAVETYGFMLTNPGSVSDVETTRFLNVIQELIARLGRTTWPDPEVEANETP